MFFLSKYAKLVDNRLKYVVCISNKERTFANVKLTSFQQ